MEATEVDGSHSLRQWFDLQPLPVRLALVARMALRLSPLHLRVAPSFGATDDHLNLAIFRITLLIAVGSRRDVALPLVVTEPALALAELIYEAAEEDYEQGRANNNSIRASLCIGSAVKALHALSANNIEQADRELQEALDCFFGADHIGDTEQLSVTLALDTTKVVEGVPDFYRGMEEYELRAWFEKDASALRQDGGKWAFWCDWYEGVFSGKEPNWQLLYEVALIPDDIWQQGPDVVAARIALIDEKVRLRGQVAELKAQLAEANARIASDQQRSHNNPPELIDPSGAIRREIAVIWGALDDAEQELTKSAPDPSLLAKIGNLLLKASVSLVKYCAGLADAALKKGAEELGTTGTKWAIPSVAAFFASQNEGVQSFAKALIEFAKALVQSGAG